MTLFATTRLLRVSNRFRNISRCNSVTSAHREEEGRKLENESHIYKEKLTAKELTNFLFDNVVYNEDNIIVTNKPYGVALGEVKKLRENFIPQTFNECYLKEVLPDLSKRLGVDSLQVHKVPERYASGVTILTSTEEASDKVKKALKGSKSSSDLLNTYLVVTVGQPVKKILETKFGLSFKENNEVPQILEKWSNTQVKYSVVKVVKWKHQVLLSTESVSLVQVELSQTLGNCLRLYLTLKCLSPVLGDRIFGSRVEKVMGVPLPVDVSVNTSQKLQELPDGLLEALKLRPEEQPIIPNLVHLHRVSLPLKKNLKLCMSVKPPESFIWTCQQLGLKVEGII